MVEDLEPQVGHPQLVDVRENEGHARVDARIFLYDDVLLAPDVPPWFGNQRQNVFDFRKVDWHSVNSARRFVPHPVTSSSVFLQILRSNFGLPPAAAARPPPRRVNRLAAQTKIPVGWFPTGTDPPTFTAECGTTAGAWAGRALFRPAQKLRTERPTNRRLTERRACVARVSSPWRP